MYKKIFRPLLFALPGDIIHEWISWGGNFIASIPGVRQVLRLFFNVQDKRLTVQIGNVVFPNPVGLSAGFDKDGKHIRFAELFGFGFIEVGSITGEPTEGNPRPYIRRLVKNQSFVINFGLKNEGSEKIHHRLSHAPRFAIPFGISVAKTNLPLYVGQKAVDDYVKVFKRFCDIGAYYTINVSCPNTFDGTPFTDPKKLEILLQQLQKAKSDLKITKPIFLKINPDIEQSQLDHIIDLALHYEMTGLVIGNLVKEKQEKINSLKHVEEYDPSWPGGLSGKSAQSLSTRCIRYVYNKTRGKLVIVGCGGIFTAEDAYEKITAGASVLELITGFIFEGPFAIRRINKGLLKRMEQDGFHSIQEAIGTKA